MDLCVPQSILHQMLSGNADSIPSSDEVGSLSSGVPGSDRGAAGSGSQQVSPAGKQKLRSSNRAPADFISAVQLKRPIQSCHLKLLRSQSGMHGRRNKTSNTHSTRRRTLFSNLSGRSPLPACLARALSMLRLDGLRVPYRCRWSIDRWRDRPRTSMYSFPTRTGTEILE